MSNTKIIFLRHADTEKDSSLSAALWELSEKGKKQAKEILALPIMNEIDIIYTSEEKKAILTIEPLAKKLNKEIYSLSFFNEIKRGSKFLSDKEFEVEKVKQLTNLDYPVFGGETGKEALTRFKKGINYVLRENPDKTILIVTHGTILNIYFSELLGAHDKLPQRWQKTDFCAYGIVEDGKVIKDIILK